MKYLYLTLSLLLFACYEPKNHFEELYLEYGLNPIGIDISNPKLAWIINEHGATYQRAYQIQVATSIEKLLSDKADAWDSGWVKSANSTKVTYEGKGLISLKSYYWRVRIKDENNKESPWSAYSSWTTGMLDDSDWNAKWISSAFAPVSAKRTVFESKGQDFDQSDSMATYFQHQFEAKPEIKKAIVCISGLGYYQLKINDKKVGDHVLDPAFTDYQRTVHYQTYDISDRLKTGKNEIEVTLGGGFYNLPTQDLFQMNRANWKTPNKMIFQLQIEYTNGDIQEVVSDSSWKWRNGEIVYNSLRGGETIDFNKEKDTLKAVHIVPAPIGKLSAQIIPPLRVNDTLHTDAIWSPKKGVYVYDFGENLTGWVRFKTQAKKGDVIRLDFNEVLNEDSTLNVKHSSGHTWGRFQKGYLVSSGQSPEVYEPRFTYHGFRYVQISGLNYEPQATDMVAMRVYTDLETAGTFECSNERLNQLHAAVRRTLENSIHSMPGEEATREKMGWTLDGGMETMESYLMNYQAINAYRKYLQDLIDSQEESGHIPPIVPTNGWGFNKGDEPFEWDDPWWGGTIFYVVQKLYQYTGDSSIVEHAYEPMTRYLEYLYSTADNDIIDWSLGDWLDLTHGQNGPGPGLTPVAVSSTAGNAHFSRQMAYFSEIVNQDQKKVEYQKNFERIRDRFNKMFLDEEGWYAKNSQTAQAMALHYELAPTDKRQLIYQRLIEAIEDNNRHTSVGFLGVKPLLYTLSENGDLPLAYEMVTQEESPGWLHFVKSKRSTMGENLNSKGYGTGHHPFSTNIGFWLYSYLGGIQPFTGSAGLDTIDLKPGLASPLEWVKCSHKTPKGKLEINWSKVNQKCDLEIKLPQNLNAKLHLPSGEIKILAPGHHQLTVENSK